jgi:hypothetical protein
MESITRTSLPRNGSFAEDSTWSEEVRPLKGGAAIKPGLVRDPIARFSFADSTLSTAPTATRAAATCTAATRSVTDTHTLGADDANAATRATVTADAAQTTDTAATLDTAQRAATADPDTGETTGTATALDTADGGVITSTALLCK